LVRLLASAALLVSLSGPAVAQTEPPKRCTAVEVRTLVVRFIRAFNAGDLKRLDRLFARKPDFRWYSTDAPGRRLGGAAYSRATLIPYFARRHRLGERLKLRSFRFNGNSGLSGDTYGNFEYGLIRSADDLSPTRYYGKGASRCYRARPDVIFVWSMAREF
jgi:hypothetical protein